MLNIPDWYLVFATFSFLHFFLAFVRHRRSCWMCWTVFTPGLTGHRDSDTPLPPALKSFLWTGPDNTTHLSHHPQPPCYDYLMKVLLPIVNPSDNRLPEVIQFFSRLETVNSLYDEYDWVMSSPEYCPRDGLRSTATSPNTKHRQNQIWYGWPWWIRANEEHHESSVFFIRTSV